jgi:5-hydroxyisourate hydrolase
MGQLTTHVLDISTGLPAAGVRIELHGHTPEGLRLLTTTATGADGRVGALLSGASFKAGSYQLTFYTAEYFRRQGVRLPEPAFLEQASVQLGIAAADQHYHVPLLIAPWSYSVYRGG